MFLWDFLDSILEIGTDGQVEEEQNTLEINMALQNEERKDHVEALGKAYKAFDDFIIGGITEVRYSRDS